MFPDERHQRIVARLDEIEARMFQDYRAIERLRLELQQEFKVLPSGERWTEERHKLTEHSGT